MLKTTHLTSSGGLAAIAPVHWQPPKDYALDVEVMTSSTLQKRASAQHFQRLQRQDFHLLMAVTSGHCQPMLDFVDVQCRTGSWLIVKPGQVHRFDFSNSWNGWILVFKPELLLPQRREVLPIVSAITDHISHLDDHLVLSPQAHKVCSQLVRQMLSDTGLPIGRQERNTLLQQQTYLLLQRLSIAAASNRPSSDVAVLSRERFQRFQHFVEGGFKQQHPVSHYAKLLSCTEKTLTRSTLQITGLSAKAFLLARTALEAKRLLAHTAVSVKEIAYELGFDEPSNFIKVFKKSVGVSPLRFRQQMAKGG